MNAGDWVLVGAVVVSLGVGVAYIVRAKMLQKNQFDHDKDMEEKERRQELLKEIKDWAINVWIIGMGTGERESFEDPEELKLLKVSLFKQVTEMKRLNREGTGFKYIDLPDWKGLVKKSKELRKEIGVQVDLIEECSKFTTDDVKYEAALNATDEHRDKMNDIAESIIEEVQITRSNLLKSK